MTNDELTDDELRAFADLYFAAYRKERNAIEREHRNRGDRLMREYGFADVDALARWFAKHSGKGYDDLGAELRARRKDAENKDHWFGALLLKYWLDTERGGNGGPLGEALSNQSGETVPYVPIFTPREMRELRDADNATLRKYPPVIVAQYIGDAPGVLVDADPRRKELFGAFILGCAAPCDPKSWPRALRSLFVALVKTIDAVREQPASVDDETVYRVDDETVRVAYRAFVTPFWGWYRRQWNNAAPAAHDGQAAPWHPGIVKRVDEYRRAKLLGGEGYRLYILAHIDVTPQAVLEDSVDLDGARTTLGMEFCFGDRDRTLFRRPRRS